MNWSLVCITCNSKAAGQGFSNVHIHRKGEQPPVARSFIFERRPSQKWLDYTPTLEIGVVREACHGFVVFCKSGLLRFDVK